MRNIFKRGLFFALVSISVIYAQEPKLIDGMKANEILRSAYDYIEAHRSFTIDAVMDSEDILNQDTVMEESRDIKVILKRPDKLYIKSDADYRHLRYYLKDGVFTIYDADINLYGEIKVAKKSIDDTLDKLFDEYGIVSPLANLLYSNLQDRVMPKAKGYYMGLRKVDGRWCHYLIFSNQIKELEVWVDAKSAPIIRKFTLIDKSTPLRLHSSVKLKWHFNSIDDRVFDFVPPMGSSKIPVKPAMKGVYR